MLDGLFFVGWCCWARACGLVFFLTVVVGCFGWAVVVGVERGVVGSVVGGSLQGG